MSAKVFVGNLEFSTTKEQLEELFAQAGSIVDVFLPSDRATGRPRGFAFVEFSSDTEAEDAIKRFDGYELGGRSLRVNAAEARQPSFGGRGGFQGGGGGGGFGGGGGGGFGPNAPPKGFGGGKSKGSRRNVRAKKRSL
ncbi:MAG TPA: RNA-binding protein [Thermoanaerobaculia bacterium]|nr:RNA-binding protein [Thermoanaerobaculia bacterium]